MSFRVAGPKWTRNIIVSSYVLGKKHELLFPHYCCIPLILTRFCFPAQMLSKKGSISPSESWERSVRIFILTNTLFEVPDIVMHAVKSTTKDVSYIFIHVMYRIHFALDPILFVGLNARYRQMVFKCWSSCLSGREVVSATREQDLEYRQGEQHPQVESKC